MILENSSRNISLSGIWAFELDLNNLGIDKSWFNRSLSDTIELPGTVDEHRKSVKNPEKETRRLTRVHPYVGPAFYQKKVNIPEEFNGKHFLFRIERTKNSTLWIDDKLIGTQDGLTTSHIYDISDSLSPGNHILTVRIDNSDVPPVGDSHQTSEHTQTNWNGLLGKINLQIRDACFIEDLQAYPDLPNKQIKLCLSFNKPCRGQLKITANATNSEIPHSVEQTFEEVTTDSQGNVDIFLELGDDMQYWNEFSPTLYHLTVTFSDDESHDSREIRIGMREFTTNNGQFQVNGHATFLRGKHDACVFPLTGYAPMDVSEWKRVLGIAKSYGINHYRFHSYCPPRAAFEAADEIGIYMQPELPCWEFLGACNVDPMGDVEFRGSGDDSLLDVRIRYLTAEGLRILREFGNHPSFCMFALGNELGGDLDLMASFVKRFRKEDPRHLYAHGSNNFIREPTQGPADDYWTTMMTGGHYSAGDFKPDSKGREVRGSFCVHTHGHVNNSYPGTTKDFSSGLKDVDVPVIGHEVGQYQVFPNFDEIGKYTGILEARNFEVFKNNLEKAGMLDLADDFFRASGALSVLCYREDIEAAIRTPGFGGFQLLDLQDFPGQGTALVGVLDAFMESKGLITPEKWREFCNDVVLLVKMEKYTWTKAESFKAELCLANYSESDLSDKSILWSLTDQKGIEITSGSANANQDFKRNIIKYTSIEVNLKNIEVPQKLELTVKLEATDYVNRYPVWVYNVNTDSGELPESIRVSETLDEESLQYLTDGGKLLLLPESDSVKQAVPGAFQSDFWCYPMFKKYDPPGTMGMLCEPDHPALSGFPTEFHSNWQWWVLLKNGCAMILDDLPDNLDPIVRVIDNFERNHRLSVIFECQVGKGKLLVCSCNLQQQQEYPEVRQLQKSLLRYMDSDNFNPKCNIKPEKLKEMFE